MSRSQRILGSIISGIGGVVVLFALLRLPSIIKIDFTNTSFLPPTTLPGIQLTTQIAMGSGWQAVFIELFAVTAIVVAIMQILTRRATEAPITRRATTALILLGVLVFVLSFLSYLSYSANFLPRPAFYSFSQQTAIYTNGAKEASATSGSAPAYYFGSGFWLYVVGMVLVIVGNVIPYNLGRIFGWVRKVPVHKNHSRYWTVWSSMFGQRQNLDLIISGIGGLLALLAFILLPYITKAQVFGRDVQLTTRTASQLTLAGNWIFLLGGVLTVMLAACIGWQMFRSRTAKETSTLQLTILLIVLSSLILVVSLILYSSSSATLVSHTFIRNPADNAPTFTCASATSSIGSDNPNAVSTTTVVGCIEGALSIDYGPGFWLYVVGMILVLVGSLEQITYLTADRTQVVEMLQRACKTFWNPFLNLLVQPAAPAPTDAPHHDKSSAPPPPSP